MTLTARKRKRTRNHPATPQPDGPLRLALNQLEDAVHALTAPQMRYYAATQHSVGHRTWLDSRYQQLRDAITTPAVSGHRHTPPSSQIPAQIDALKLAMHIDHQTRTLTPQYTSQVDTPTRLQQTLDEPWRPQDSKHLTELANHITIFSKAIDDLFSVKPIYLPDACPQCRHTWAYRISDDAEKIRTPALAVTPDRGAWCQQCHTTWTPDRLVFLGRLLGYHTAGIA